ncbi:MAG: hypothetical protein IJ494_01785 [Bacteroides sp.]|nr:hypothetical protein [Bacteroides sp.]
MYCENPNIILSKSLSSIVTKFGNHLSYTDGIHYYRFRGNFPAPATVGATIDNYKNWCICTPDGELIPMYTPVPCGHCLLCAEKKAKEWSTRASCEANTAIYPALFITLTYEAKYLPKDGVEKEAVQKFLKRFRINWKRTYGEELDLRYFAVGEYGRNFGRPHYHVLAWNIPNHGDVETNEAKFCLWRVLQLVERTWSVKITKEEFEKLPDYMRYCEERMFYGKLQWCYYRKIGRVEVTADRGKSSGYCMKYMRKPKHVPDNWKNPTFYLSSRRTGGIGMRYLTSNYSEYRNNLSITTIPVLDKKENKVYDYSMPRCFKDKLFPSLSLQLSGHIRNSIERFAQVHQLLHDTLVNHDYKAPEQIQDFLDMMTLRYEATRHRYGQAFDRIVNDALCYKKDNLYPTPLYASKSRWTESEYESYCNELAFAHNLLYRTLYLYQPDATTIDKNMNDKEIRKNILSSRKYKEVDVAYERYKILQKIHEYERRESF